MPNRWLNPNDPEDRKLLLWYFTLRVPMQIRSPKQIYDCTDYEEWIRYFQSDLTIEDRYLQPKP